MKHRITKLFIFISLTTGLFATEVKQVKTCAKEAKNFKLGEPFDFTVGPHAIYFDKKKPQLFAFFIGASEAKKGNEFSIAAGYRNDDKILLTEPAKINLNFKANQVNPLTGAKIELLSLISIFPVAVKSGENNVIYIHNEGGGLLSTPKLNDANDQTSSKIIQIATVDNNALTGSAIFAAVKNNKNQLFGADGSGIVFVALENKTIIKDKTKVTCKKPNCEKCQAFKKENEQTVLTTNVYNVDPEDKKAKENKAAPFTGSINAIKINNPANIISDVIDMYWDATLARLYIALQVRSNSKSDSGARAIVSCRIVGQVKEKIKTYKLYFDPIVTNLAISGNNQIIGTLQANTDVSILKVRTMHTSTFLSYLIVLDKNNQLYALPLVDKTREKVNLAFDKIHGTLAKFDQDPITYFTNDFFIARAFTNPAMNPNDLLTVNQAAAKIGNGPVPLDKKVNDMFVLDDAVYVTTQEGAYYSQPIFDNLGRISAWTNWQLFATDKKVFAGAFDVITGQFWYLTGENSKKINTLNRTDWQTNDKNEIQKNINALFIENGGIQGLFEFPKNKLMVATGNSQVALINSKNMHNVKIFKDIVLQEIGNIVTAAFVNNLLVVGGTNGLAIKHDNRFKKIGDYKLVKKIYSEDKYLYVLTDKTFDRVELDNQLNIVTLASLENIIFNPQVTFSDFIVSGKFILLGTSIGLFKLDGIQKLTEINIPGSVGPILKIIFNRSNNIGQLYVLSGYIGFYQSKINRLFVDLLNNTIEPINDMFIKNELTSFYDFESFRDIILPVGSTLLNINSKDLDEGLALRSTPFLQTASRALTIDSFKYNLDANKLNQIYGILQNSATGSLILNGDFGLIINQ